MRRIHRRNRVVYDELCKLDMRLNSGFMSGVIVQDRSQSPYDGTAIGGTGTPVPLYPGFDFIAASTQYIDIGAGYNGIKTVLLWINPDSVAGTDIAISMNATDALGVSTGTLTKGGFVAGTSILYVDAVAAATTVTANWHLIGITNTTGVNASDLDVGRLAAGYFDGVLGGVLLFAKVLTPTEIQTIYNVTKFRYGVAA